MYSNQVQNHSTRFQDHQKYHRGFQWLRIVHIKVPPTFNIGQSKRICSIWVSCLSNNNDKTTRSKARSDRCHRQRWYDEIELSSYSKQNIVDRFFLKSDQKEETAKWKEKRRMQRYREEKGNSPKSYVICFAPAAGSWYVAFVHTFSFVFHAAAAAAGGRNALLIRLSFYLFRLHGRNN